MIKVKNDNNSVINNHLYSRLILRGDEIGLSEYERYLEENLIKSSSQK